jgi:hypothetical protein
MAGREFDDGSLSWADLHAFIFASPPGTAIFHAIEKGWTTTDYLLAHVIDGIRINNWQRTEGATKRPPRDVPESFPRPADLEDKKNTAPEVGDSVGFGNSVATVTTVGDFLAKRAQRQARWRERNNNKDGGGN